MGTNSRHLSPVHRKTFFHILKETTWLVPSKPHVSPPEERPQESSSLPRPPESLLQLSEESRSHTDTDLEPSLFVRSEDTRSLPSFSSESSHSRDLSERSPRTSSLTLDSRALLSLPSRKLPRPTLSVFSRTPTCAPSTPSVSPSCQRTSSWPEESVVRELKLLQ